jgi:hypothetical protein
MYGQENDIPLAASDRLVGILNPIVLLHKYIYKLLTTIWSMLEFVILQSLGNERISGVHRRAFG